MTTRPEEPEDVGERPHEQSRGWRTAAAARLADSDAALLLYGAIVAATVLAIATAPGTPTGRVGLAVGGVLVIYWAAHVYVRTVAERLAAPDATARSRVVRAVGHEGPLLVGGLPTLVIFVVARLVGADVAVAADVALVVNALLLAGAGYLTGVRAGSQGWRLAAETATAALFGVLTIALRTLLH